MRHPRRLFDARERPDEEMDGDGSPVKRWPTIDSRCLLSVKTPSWLRSLTLHHQRYEHSKTADPSDGRLPKLNAMDDEADGSCGEIETNNNDSATKRRAAAHRFAKLSRIALPPLGTHEAQPAADSSLNPPASWLLPIIPSVQRRDAYKQQTRERKQFSAQTSRLPPIPAAGSSASSLSAPLPSNKGLMELYGSSPAKLRDDGATGAPLAALARRGEAKSEKLARIAPGAWDATAKEKSDAHLRSTPSDAIAALAGQEASSSRQVASEPGLPSLSGNGTGSSSSSSGGGSAGPPVGRRTSADSPGARAARSRDPASNQRTSSSDAPPLAADASAAPAAASNKQRRPPAVRWTIEWTDEHQISPPPSPVENAPAQPETDGQEPPVMASPSAQRRVEREFRSAGRVRRSPPPPPPRASSESPVDESETFRPARSQSPPVPAVLARQLRAKTAHPSLSVERADSNDATSSRSSTVDRDDDDDDQEIIEDIQLQDLQLNDSSPEESIKQQPFRDGNAGLGEDDEEDENRENIANFGSNLHIAADQLSRSSSIEHLKKLLNNNQPDEDPKQVPASSPTFRRAPSERLVYREENCLPNVVQNPDDRPAFVKSSKSNRLTDYPMEFDDEKEIFGRGSFKSSQERVLAEDEEYEDDFELGSNHYPTSNSTTASPSKSAVRLGTKSRSLASFAGRSSPDDSARRQRSLPTRRLDSSNVVEVKRTGLMPSSRKPALVASSAAVRTRSPPVTNFKTPPDTLDPKIGLQMALKGINAPEWEDKLEGLRRLNELLTGYSDNLAHETHTIALALLVEVKNLRSQVSRAAIQSMGKMFQHCGKHMEQDLDRSVSLLLNKTGDTNRFIRDDAHAALVIVTEYVSAPKAIVAITAEGLTHKNSTVRAEAAKLLAAIVVRLGPAKTLCGAKDVTERILPAAAHFIQDGSLEARGQAKIMFSVMIKDPTFDKAVVKYLSPAVVRNIQRTLDVLRKNPQPI